MMKIFSRLLKSPLFDTEEETRLASFVHTVTLALIPASILISLIDGLAGIYVTGVILLPSAVLLGLSDYLLRIKKLRAASLLFLGVLILVLTLLLLTGQGIHDIGITMYPLILLAAALILNRHDYIFIVVLEIASLAFINLGEIFGFFDTLDLFEPRLADLLIISVILLVAAISFRGIAENLTQSLEKMRKSERELALSNLELEKRARVIQLSEARWRSVIDNAPTSIISIKSDGLISFSNQVDEDGNDFYAGKNVYMALPRRQRQAAQKIVAEIFETGVASSFENLLYNQKGNLRWFQIKLGPVFSPDNKVSELIIIAEDIHDRKLAEEQVRILNAELEARVLKRTEELETANRELEAFSYTVSHDLRAPLRAIHGYSRLLAGEISGQLSPDGQDYLKRISSNAQKMGTLIDELLAFSRLGRKTLHLEPINMEKMAWQVFDDLTQQESVPQIEFSVSALPNVNADAGLLKQALSNLIGNAIKFSRKRENAKIEVGSDQNGAQTVFFVRDNGAGFDMAYAGKIFEVFTRLHTDDQFEGTGVGLAIVHRIIEKHGGRIWAESEIGKGSTFYFTLG